MNLYRKMIAYFILTKQRNVTTLEVDTFRTLYPFIKNITFYQNAENPFDRSKPCDYDIIQRFLGAVTPEQNKPQVPVTLPQTFEKLRQLAQGNSVPAHLQIQPTAILPLPAPRNSANALEKQLEPQAIAGVESAYLDFLYSDHSYLDVLEFIGALSAICQAYNRNAENHNLTKH